MSERIEFRLPGSDALLVVTREGGATVLRIAGREYLRRCDDLLSFDAGAVRMRDVCVGRRLLRRVATAVDVWWEEYRLDEAGRPDFVDGVTITRDGRGRVVACESERGTWRYTFEGERLRTIETPHETRQLAWDDDRPVGYTSGGHWHDVARTAAIPPDGHAWHRDGFGRLWCESAANGAIVRTWLWDAFRCVGRIDGPPGDPLAAVFSLDPSGTPVRIITPRGVTVVPRDAYGEGMLAHDGVPGLFGGRVERDVVQLPQRALDPRVGAWTSADPCDGGDADPRRTWSPVLAQADADALGDELCWGRHTVARHDPVGRADPTGAISWGVILSDLTWSLQNFSFGLFGLDLSVNFWASLLTLCTERSRGYFTTFQFETGTRQGTWALVRRGLLSNADNRAWTYHHLLFEDPDSLDALLAARAVALDARWVPRRYGTTIRVTPASGTPYLLAGDAGIADRIPAATTAPTAQRPWTRAGGTAEPVFPGSQVPWFPNGGVHFDAADPANALGGRCTVTELAPSGVIAQGTVAQRARLDLPGTGLGVVAGTLILLVDATNRAVIVSALGADEADGATSVWLASSPGGIDATGLRARALDGAPLSSEVLARGPNPGELQLPAASAGAPALPDYELGDPLRCTDGAAVSAAIIASFRASIQVDEGVPAALGDSVGVFATSPGATGQGTLDADAQKLRITSGTPVPGSGNILRLTAGSVTRACVVSSVDAADAALLTVDRVLTPLGVAGTPVSWTVEVPAVAALGTATGVAAGDTTLAWVPPLERTAPAVGRTIELQGAGARAARTVTALVSDLLQCPQTIAGAGAVTVERLRVRTAGTPGAFDIAAATLSNGAVLSLAPAVALAGEAIRLVDTGAAALPAVAAAATYTLMVNGAAPVTLAGGAPLVVGTPVQLTAGGPPELAVLTGLRATITLDTTVAALDGARDVSVLSVGTTAANYDAVRRGALLVAVLPSAGAVQLQLPRFRPGELVLATWDAGQSRAYRVDAVEANGSTITLADAPALPDPTPNLRIRRLDLPWDFATGTTTVDTAPLRARLPDSGSNADGIGGTARSAAAGTEIIVDIWNSTTLRAGTRIAITAGGRSSVGTIATITFTVVFATAPTLVPSVAAPVSITPLPIVAAGFTRQFRQEGGNGVLLMIDPPFTPAATSIVLAMPFVDTGNVGSGTYSSGTTLVPDDPEQFELERRQSLVDHELAHTEQASYWGPMLFSWFPLWIFNVFTELLSDQELPPFSRYVDATMTRDEQGVFLTIPEAHGVPFAAGDVLQVTHRLVRTAMVNLTAQPAPRRFTVVPTHNATAADALSAGPVLVSPGTRQMEGRVGGTVSRVGDAWQLDIPDAGGFTFAVGEQAYLEMGDPLGTVTLSAQDPNDAKRWAVRDFASISPGAPVLVRRAGQGSAWNDFYDVMNFTTQGGLGTFVFTQTWGWVIYGMLKLGYGLGRAVAGRDDSFAATVGTPADRVTLEGALPGALRDASHVTVEGAGTSLVRRVLARTGATLQLSAPLPLTGAVQVRPYSTTGASKFDWHDHYPATVPDAAAPTVIRLETVGDDSLTLRTFDRVLLTAGEVERVTRVMAVRGDGAVELEEPPPFTGAERRLTVAHLSFAPPENTPLQKETGWNKLIDPTRITGLTFLRVMMDPYGQLDVLTRSDNKVLRWITRVGRWLFGARSWSLIHPGWFFLDNMPKQLATNAAGSNMGHTAQMEQEASASSGDLYAPMSRLRPEGRTRQVVGDLSRMWFWPWGNRGTVTAIQGNRGDRPGYHYGMGNWPVVLPSASAESNTTPVNFGAATALGAGSQLADALTFRDPTRALLDPVTTLAPDAFVPTPTAFIPTSARLERMSGIYVAFTAPGTHRLTVQDGINQALDAREAHDGGSSYGITFRQPILFDCTVSDVTVTVNGAAAAAGGTLTLVQTQRARVAVSPNGARRYATALVAPASGDALRLDDDGRLLAVGTGLQQFVEIARLHTPGSADLAPHGMHLLEGDLPIPVRQFFVDVVDTLPVRSAAPTGAALVADPAALTITDLAVGATGVLVVPTTVRGALTITAVDGAPPVAGALTLTQGATAGLSPDLDVLLGDDGSVLDFSIASATVPLPAPMQLELALPVGRPGIEATLRITLRLVP
jgi:hypothetical protein